jgi:riboflavin kinase / FMN adenylyltransferase
MVFLSFICPVLSRTGIKIFAGKGNVFGLLLRPNVNNYGKKINPNFAFTNFVPLFMNVYTKIEDLKLEKQSVVTIGTFDGVHLGHKKIISRLLEISKETGYESLIFTFEPHPRSVLFPDQKDLKLLTTREEKAAILLELGIEHLLEFPFTREFSQIDPAVYVKEILAQRLNMKKLVIGYDHRFGKNRAGSIELLRQMSRELKFEVEEIPAQDIDEINISSTRIRKALEEGNIRLANTYLGYNYFMTGMVVEGKKLGRELGFPTANLDLKNNLKLIPKIGVYAVEVMLEGENKKRKGMMSVGVNPTTDADNTLKLEVNIFDFNADIYNRKISVHFSEYIRPELKFSGLEELTREIENDKRKVLEILNK